MFDENYFMFFFLKITKVIFDENYFMFFFLKITKVIFRGVGREVVGWNIKTTLLKSYSIQQQPQDIAPELRYPKKSLVLI